MRRALIEEHALDALRLRCGEVGMRLIVETDRDGEATLLIGTDSFSDWTDAVDHVDSLEAAAQEAA